jgi:outer membrane protein TolC
MCKRLAWALMLAGTAALMLSGCLVQREPVRAGALARADFSKTALEIEYPDVEAANADALGGTTAPHAIADHAELKYQDLSLQEAIHLALQHSQVMTDLGGTVLRAPESMRTTYNPAVQETDPQLGVEGALSAFDAQFASSLFAERNDRRFNNRFVGDLGFFDQEFDVFKAEITKRAVTGSQFTVRKTVDFDHNNNLGNQFAGGAWDVFLEGEVRHPFLRGGGVEFNRIAGTNGQNGVYNGVLIARVRTDITLADFQMGVRDLLSNVENAYWDLYYAYRDLDTKIRARDTALETWRRTYALYKTGRRGGEAEKEAQAREQYYRFESDVQNALSGHPLEGTRTNNGTSPGTFRAIPGAYLAERRLRLIMGLPPNDEFLFRPNDEPPVARVSFDWPVIVDEALSLREELRRQRWEVKRRDLELIASKNSLLPSLDFVGRYRWRGFGEKLIDAERAGQPPFDNAFMDLTGGRFQEWQMGMEFTMPFGFRQGHAAVRNAELRVAQARAVLREQELQISHDLSTAVSELDRAYSLLQTEMNRVIAANQQLNALLTAYEADKAEFFVVLDAQRRLADAEIRYHQARVEYILALRNVHFEKGSLLAYCGVVLSEGPWPLKAYLDAARLEKRRYIATLRTDYRLDPPNLVASGYDPQPDGTTPEPPSETGQVPAAPAVPGAQPQPVPSPETTQLPPPDQSAEQTERGDPRSFSPQPTARARHSQDSLREGESAEAPPIAPTDASQQPFSAVLSDFPYPQAGMDFDSPRPQAGDGASSISPRPQAGEEPEVREDRAEAGAEDPQVSPLEQPTAATMVDRFLRTRAAAPSRPEPAALEQPASASMVDMVDRFLRTKTANAPSNSPRPQAGEGSGVREDLPEQFSRDPQVSPLEQPTAATMVDRFLHTRAAKASRAAESPSNSPRPQAGEAPGVREDLPEQSSRDPQVSPLEQPTAATMVDRFLHTRAAASSQREPPALEQPASATMVDTVDRFLTRIKTDPQEPQSPALQQPASATTPDRVPAQ